MIAFFSKNRTFDFDRSVFCSIYFSAFTSMIERSAYSITRTLLFLLCCTVFFGKTSNCEVNEYVLGVRANTSFNKSRD